MNFSNPKRTLTRMAAVALLAGVTTGGFVYAKSTKKADDTPHITWLTSAKAAAAQAKKENKLIFADFTGSDWCGYCIKLKKEVLDTPEFAEWASDKLVFLEVDFPNDKSKMTPDEIKQNDALQAQFKVEGFPTIIYLDSTGKELGRQVGFGGKAGWMPEAKKIVEANMPEKDAAKAEKGGKASK